MKDKTCQGYKTDDLPDVLTAEILSQYLSLSKRRVYELMDLSIEGGGIPCMRIGRSKRVLKSDLINWMNELRRKDEKRSL